MNTRVFAIVFFESLKYIKWALLLYVCFTYGLKPIAAEASNLNLKFSADQYARNSRISEVDVAQKELVLPFYENLLGDLRQAVNFHGDLGAELQKEFSNEPVVLVSLSVSTAALFYTTKSLMVVPVGGTLGALRKAILSAPEGIRAKLVAVPGAIRNVAASTARNLVSLGLGVGVLFLIENDNAGVLLTRDAYADLLHDVELKVADLRGELDWAAR